MKTITKISIAIVSASIISSCTGNSVSNKSSKLPPAENIISVWNLYVQPCNGAHAEGMSRHPDQESIKLKKTIKVNDLGFEFLVPQIQNIKTTSVKLFLNDKSRGVTDSYFLISDQDLSSPVAAIVVTELPENLQNTSKAFESVNILERQLARNAAGAPPVELTEIDGPYGKSLELLLTNRVGSGCFPTATFQFSQSGNLIKTIGISRFSLINKKLVEFALVVSIPSGTNDSEAVSMARKTMDSFWLGIKSI